MTKLFTQAIQADEIRVKNIGENAKEAPNKLGIKITR